jgi:hypothetical protein
MIVIVKIYFITCMVNFLGTCRQLENLNPPSLHPLSYYPFQRQTYTHQNSNMLSVI